MEYDLSQLQTSDIYKLMTGSIIPRPIAWVSSQSEKGDLNLAPFSYFNAVSANPPILMISIGHKNATNLKDTLRNILETREFVVNFVTRDNVEAMNATAINAPYGVDEFKLAGLTPVASQNVKVPRVKESPIHFECKLSDTHEFPENTVVFGEIIHIQMDDDICLDNYKIDVDRYKPIARLAGTLYAELDEVFSLERPVYTKES
ncbi:MAG: flavin reductase family protein [Trueperaceae bacterium]|nr:flavin reductase family protein [Trueperaceae bacterium]